MEKETVSKQKYYEHIQRKVWNKNTCLQLGLTLERKTKHEMSISIRQGFVLIYHEKSEYNDLRTIYRLHLGAEVALKKHIRMLNDNGISTPGIMTLNYG